MIQHLPPVTSDAIVAARAIVRDPASSDADVKNACFTLSQSTDPMDQTEAREIRKARLWSAGIATPVQASEGPYAPIGMTGTNDYMAQPGVDWTRAHVRPAPAKPSTLRGWLEVAAWVILIAALVYIAAQIPKALSDAMIVGDAAPMGEW